MIQTSVACRRPEDLLLADLAPSTLWSRFAAEQCLVRQLGNIALSENVSARPLKRLSLDILDSFSIAKLESVDTPHCALDSTRITQPCWIRRVRLQPVDADSYYLGKSRERFNKQITVRSEPRLSQILPLWKEGGFSIGVLKGPHHQRDKPMPPVVAQLRGALPGNRFSALRYKQGLIGTLILDKRTRRANYELALSLSLSLCFSLSLSHGLESIMPRRSKSSCRSLHRPDPS